MDPRRKRLPQPIESTVAGLSSAQFSGQVAGECSAGGICEHLYCTYTGMRKELAPVVDGGKPLASKPTAPPVEKVWGILPKITAIDEFLTECAATFAGGVKVLDHSFLGPFSIAEWRKVRRVHGFDHRKADPKAPVPQSSGRVRASGVTEKQNEHRKSCARPRQRIY